MNDENNCEVMVSKKKKRKKYFHELDNTLVIKKGNPPVRYHRQQQ